MSQNKVVAHYRDDRILKGFTVDFLPTKPTFHLTHPGASPAPEPVKVRVDELKAVFFVKDLAGRAKPARRRQEFSPGKVVLGRKVQVVFSDGEVLVGTTQGYDAERKGFFVFPADTSTNNESIFVVKQATRQVSFI
jgi:hypothetical protein